MKKKNLCNACARAQGLIPYFDPISTNLTGTSYQLGKYLDHTKTGARTGEVVSIYSDPTYEGYRAKFFSGVHSGSYHVDSKGRESMVFVVDSNCGFSWDDVNKKPLYAEDAVRLVCFQDSTKVHHYSQCSSAFAPTWCDQCGELVL